MAPKGELVHDLRTVYSMRSTESYYVVHINRTEPHTLLHCGSRESTTSATMSFITSATTKLSRCRPRGGLMLAGGGSGGRSIRRGDRGGRCSGGSAAAPAVAAHARHSFGAVAVAAVGRVVVFVPSQSFHNWRSTGEAPLWKVARTLLACRSVPWGPKRLRRVSRTLLACRSVPLGPKRLGSNYSTPMERLRRGLERRALAWNLSL